MASSVAIRVSDQLDCQKTYRLYFLTGTQYSPGLATMYLLHPPLPSPALIHLLLKWNRREVKGILLDLSQNTEKPREISVMFSLLFWNQDFIVCNLKCSKLWGSLFQSWFKCRLKYSMFTLFRSVRQDFKLKITFVNSHKVKVLGEVLQNFFPIEGFWNWMA